MINWTEVAQRDAQLRVGVDDASEALARHRHENTIAVGVSFAEYARQCGVNPAAVRRYATAWEMKTSGLDVAPATISDALVRAATSAVRADVIEAVAESRGVSMKAVQAHHQDEVRRVESIARERATKQGTTVREEAAKLAETAERQRRAELRHRAERRQRADLRYLELERHLQTARRALVNAAAVDANLDDEHRELIADAVRVVRDLIGLVDMRFVGAANVDWDAELARITGGSTDD